MNAEIPDLTCHIALFSGKKKIKKLFNNNKNALKQTEQQK